MTNKEKICKKIAMSKGIKLEVKTEYKGSKYLLINNTKIFYRPWKEIYALIRLISYLKQKHT